MSISTYLSTVQQGGGATTAARSAGRRSARRRARGGGGGEGGGSTSQLNCGVQDKAFLSRAKGYFGTEHSMFRLKLVK